MAHLKKTFDRKDKCGYNFLGQFRTHLMVSSLRPGTKITFQELFCLCNLFVKGVHFSPKMHVYLIFFHWNLFTEAAQMFKFTFQGQLNDLTTIN